MSTTRHIYVSSLPWLAATLQQIHNKSLLSSITSICCGFVDARFVVDLLYSLLYNKSTTNRTSGVCHVLVSCTMPQSLADASCSAVQYSCQYTRIQDWTWSEFCTWQNSVRGKRPRKCIYSVAAQETVKHRTKFGWPPVSGVGAVTKARRETRWNLLGCPKLANRSRPLTGRNRHIVRTCGEHIAVQETFWLSIHTLVAEIQCD